MPREALTTGANLSQGCWQLGDGTMLGGIDTSLPRASQSMSFRRVAGSKRPYAALQSHAFSS